MTEVYWETWITLLYEDMHAYEVAENDLDRVIALQGASSALINAHDAIQQLMKQLTP